VTILVLLILFSFSVVQHIVLKKTTDALDAATDELNKLSDTELYVNNSTTGTNLRSLGKLPPGIVIHKHGAASISTGLLIKD